jgi:hypothetical protein
MWERHLAAIIEHFESDRNPPAADHRVKDGRFKTHSDVGSEL